MLFVTLLVAGHVCAKGRGIFNYMLLVFFYAGFIKIYLCYFVGFKQ